MSGNRGRSANSIDYGGGKPVDHGEATSTDHGSSNGDSKRYRREAKRIAKHANKGATCF